MPARHPVKFGSEVTDIYISSRFYARMPTCLYACQYEFMHHSCYKLFLSPALDAVDRRWVPLHNQTCLSRGRKFCFHRV